MSVLTEQCKQELCVNASETARAVGITQKTFITRELWDAFILPQEEQRMFETILMWKVREAMDTFPGHDTFPALVEFQSGDKVVLRQPVEVSVVDGEVVVDIRLAG